MFIGEGLVGDGNEIAHIDLLIGSKDGPVGNSALTRATLRLGSVLANYPARNIGPTQQGGRIVDLDADPSNAKVLYVAYASGGVWKTTNNGMSFYPIFDEQGTMGIGDIAVSTANPDVIWVGTGECNSSKAMSGRKQVFTASHLRIV